MSYLPKQLSGEELVTKVHLIAENIGATSNSDFSKLMPAAIKELKGQADGKAVKEAVEIILGIK